MMLSPWLYIRSTKIYFMIIDFFIFFIFINLLTVIDNKFFFLLQNSILSFVLISINYFFNKYELKFYRYSLSDNIKLYLRLIINILIINFYFSFSFFQIFEIYFLFSLLFIFVDFLTKFYLIKFFSRMKKIFSFKNYLFLVEENLFLDIKKNFSKEVPNATLICIEDINEIKNYDDDKTLVITSDRYFSNKYKLNKFVNQISLFQFYQIYFENIPTNIFNLSHINKHQKKLIYLTFQQLLKRIFDISISLIILLFSLPFLLIIFLLIKIEDGGPTFYKQLRTGKNNKVLTIYKLRSMHIDSEKNGIKWCKQGDQRITKIGIFIRKTKIDELPQLFSVLKGDMSLIGPRPERPEFDKLLSRNIPDYNFRYKVKPGLSGWAQVKQNYPSSIEEAKIKLNYDFYYINNFSLFLDLLIFFKTIRLVINIDDRQI